MLSTIVIIALISLGSVWMDSNLKEFCAKNYFHSFVANYSKGKTTLQLSRKVDESSYHSWVLPVQENAKILDTTQIQHSLNANEMPRPIRTQLGGCTIDMSIEVGGNKFVWFLTYLVIINNDIKGSKIKYKQFVVRVNDFNTRREESIEEMESEPLPSGLWLSGLFCNASDKTLYAIFEERTSMNDSNGTQFVSRIDIQKTSHTENKKILLSKLGSFVEKWGNQTHHKKVLYFSMHSKRETVNEFLGIDCSIYTQLPTIEPESVPTRTLFVIVLVLVVSAAILSIIDLILIIKRRQQKPDLSVDTPYEKTLQTSVSTVTQSTSSNV